MGVYIPYTSYDYTQMQGPAPSGFHVPLSSEWQAVYDAGVSIGAWTSSGGTNVRNYLKLPFAGLRNRGSSNVSNQGSDGYYWSSSPYNESSAYRFRIGSSNIYPQSTDGYSYGFCVRCFKDVPVVPTSSWTTLYQGTGNAGVFWNSTDGLISVSGNGTTWYTIQDKNLGATTVYNQGDTLTDANCGYFYQWGNNYGFPHSGTVTTSSTKVDASNYGPGNYYSSSTFITVSGRPYNRSSVQNDNLWGATTGVKPMSEMKNAYIGEYIPLKSYEEIIAMSADNAVAELNTYPQEYYDKFSSEQYVRNYDGDYYITVGKGASTAQRWGDAQRDYRWIYYNSQSWISTNSEPVK